MEETIPFHAERRDKSESRDRRLSPAEEPRTDERAEVSRGWKGYAPEILLDLEC